MLAWDQISKREGTHMVDIELKVTSEQTRHTKKQKRPRPHRQ